MISLFLDTCSHNIIVGVYNDSRELNLRIEENDNHLSERLLPIIKKTLNEINMKINEIDCIFVVTGPGSFTGIRIGVTVAKVLAWTMNKKIYPISELEVLASSTKNKYIAPLIDARRNYVYAGLYDKSGKNIINDKYISLNDFLNSISKYKKVEFVSYDNLNIESLKVPTLDITKIIKNHLNDSNVNVHDLNPNYLKLTEAEEKLSQND